MIAVQTLWRQAVDRVRVSHTDHVARHLTDEASIADAFEFLEFRVQTPTGPVRTSGWATRPPQIVARHLITWQFRFDDLHCLCWPLEQVLWPVLNRELHPITLEAA